jgi:ankyrin repeat protein
MARKKATRKQETKLVPHRSPNLSCLLDKAKSGDSIDDVRAYLGAGGSAKSLVELPIGGYKVSLLNYMALKNAHPHKDLARSVQLLVAAGADINAASTGPLVQVDSTALSSAVVRPCCSKVLQIMLQNGADPSIHWRTIGGAALHMVASDGCTEFKFKLLLDSAPDLVDAASACGSTPLALAACQGYPPLVELLHRRGASLHIRDSEGATPLHLAASKGHVAVMRYLIRNGADVNAANPEGQRPLHKAASRHIAPVKLLLASGAAAAAADHQGFTAALAATVAGRLDVLQHLVLHYSASVNTTDMRGYTLLMMAAHQGDLLTGEWLIESGAAVSAAAAADGCTALHTASQQGRTSVIALLLAHGANVHSADHSGLTALDMAAWGGHTEAAKALIAAGADVNHTDNQGSPCLHRAVDSSLNSGHTDTVQLLLESGATALLDTQVPCACAMGAWCGTVTAVMMCKHAAVLKLLLAAGADVHATTSTGNSCLHIAAAHSYPAPVLCLLIKAGADLHAVNSAGKTAAKVARDYHSKLAEQLLTRAAQD